MYINFVLLNVAGRSNIGIIRGRKIERQELMVKTGEITQQLGMPAAPGGGGARL